VLHAIYAKNAGFSSDYAIYWFSICKNCWKFILKKFAKHNLLILLSALLFLCTQPARAQGVDPLIEGAKLCTRHLQHYEREYGIPAHLLSAIASTESGRYHDGLKIRLPWPWTINAEGKGYYFDNKEQAIAAAQKLRARGVQSFDVGCMQVNMYHHSQAFSSLTQAFEPENNVAYAASFLRDLYQDEGNWKKAAADYHSKTPTLGKEYVGLVYNSWFNIIDKLRSARLSVPTSSMDGLRQMQQADSSLPSKPVAMVNTVAKPVAATPKTYTIAANGIQKSSSLKSISVRSTGEKNKENGVIIIRPEIKVVDAGKREISDANRPPEPMVMADASSLKQTKQVSDLQPVPNAKVVSIGDNLGANLNAASPATQPVKKSGPNFIFND